MPTIRVPVSWLKEYVAAEGSVAEIAGQVDMGGKEVDRIEGPGGGWDHVWVGRIAKLEKHPDADKLQLATVEYGEGRIKTVVTGATNLSTGDVVPYAEVGAKLREGHGDGWLTLEPKKMRGIMSEGMVCSAKELGLGEDHEGILILDKTLAVGQPLADALGDPVLVLELQPNRPDCMGVIGIARELAAVQRVALHDPKVAKLKLDLGAEKLAVRIEDPSGCRRFGAAYLENVKIGPSPKWMQERLVAAGMRPIDNAVDITNYVMLELGQPLHAYDADRLKGKELVARRAHPGESMRTLDGVDRLLSPDVLVIADAERSLGIAGILGGADSEIRPDTTRIALEAANFEPRGIDRTAQKLGLSQQSAASARFRLNLSPELVPLALARAVQLLLEHAGATSAGIRVELPDGRLPLHERRPLEEVREDVRDRLVGSGLQEAISYPLVDPGWLVRLAHDGVPIAVEPITLQNPTSAAQAAARPTLRASLLDTASRNLKHRDGVAIFEIAPVYLPRAADLPDERWTIGILIAGQAEQQTWLTAARDWDIHDLKGLVDGLQQATRSGRGTIETGAPGLHPGRSWRLVDGERTAVGARDLHPRVGDDGGLPPARVRPRRPRGFYDRPTRAVARDLLGKILVFDGPRGRRAVRIVEAEAYLGERDPASHAFRGVTPRTVPMFGPGGFSYVYTSHGIYPCMNVVAEGRAIAGAVLLRGAEPLEGVVEDPRRLAGPGLLCLAMGITTAQTNLDLVRSELTIRDAPAVSSRAVSPGPRIGLSPAPPFDQPWRDWITGSPGVSPP